MQVTLGSWKTLLSVERPVNVVLINWVHWNGTLGLNKVFTLSILALRENYKKKLGLAPGFHTIHIIYKMIKNLEVAPGFHIHNGFTSKS